MVELLAGFPAAAAAACPELTALVAAGDLIRGSLVDAGWHLALAAEALASVPADRRGRVQCLLAALRLLLARRRLDFPVVFEEAQRLLAMAEAADAARLGLREDLRAIALISLGIGETWALRFEDADRHLEQGVTLARRIGRPYLELKGLALGAYGMLQFRPDALYPERARQAIELAERHGWGDEPLAGIAYDVLGAALLYQGRLAEAEPWLERAERTLRTEAEPAAGMSLRYDRAVLEMARSRFHEALAAFESADKLAAALATPHTSMTSMRLRMLQTLVRLCQTERVQAALAKMDEPERASSAMRTALAALRLAQHDPQAAADALALVLDGPLRRPYRARMVTALLLEAMARDALGDHAAAGRATERALDITEPDGMLLPFLLDPAPALLERHSSGHPALVAQILDLLGGRTRPGPPPGQEARGTGTWRLAEPLTDSEIRVLRYLPTHLTAQEIAAELSVSVHTVTTHMRHLYAKLGVHRRCEAVARARALGAEITRNM